MILKNKYLRTVSFKNFPIGDGEGDGGDDNGGDKNGSDFTQSQEFKDAVKNAVSSGLQNSIDDATKGLKQKNEQLIEGLSAAKDQLKSFEGFDAEKVKIMLEQIDQSEEAKLIADGQLDEVVKRRVDKDRGVYEDQITELKTNSDTLVGERDHYKSKYEGNKINDKVRLSAIEAGVDPLAVEDVLSRARNVFSVSESGEVEARDKNGELLRTSDNQLMTTNRFVEDLKKSCPYYWPGSQSSGAQGSDYRTNEKDGMVKLEEIATGKNGNVDMEAYREARKKQGGDNYHKRS